MSTLLAEYPNRKAAHGRHVCGYCYRRIAAGERYVDQRLTDNGTAWTWRAHQACHSAYWTWDIDPDDSAYPLVEVSEGHLPPCPLAWSNRLGPCSCGVARVVVA